MGRSRCGIWIRWPVLVHCQAIFLASTRSGGILAAGISAPPVWTVHGGFGISNPRQSYYYKKGTLKMSTPSRSIMTEASSPPGKSLIRKQIEEDEAHSRINKKREGYDCEVMGFTVGPECGAGGGPCRDDLGSCMVTERLHSCYGGRRRHDPIARYQKPKDKHVQDPCAFQ